MTRGNDNKVTVTKRISKDLLVRIDKLVRENYPLFKDTTHVIEVALDRLLKEYEKPSPR